MSILYALVLHHLILLTPLKLFTLIKAQTEAWQSRKTFKFPLLVEVMNLNFHFRSSESKKFCVLKLYHPHNIVIFLNMCNKHKGSDFNNL